MDHRWTGRRPSTKRHHQNVDAAASLRSNSVLGCPARIIHDSLALTPGTRLGPYEVIAQIGVGGMGEVYRATDTNLKRAVAIKVLPASVAADAERLARFQREAEVLAALNHPNIAVIYGLERSRDTTGLVMELVEGEDLSERIARGAIPLDEALPVAKQVAEALEAAHEQGIIHRDLKPANIKLRPDGTVKVLDFGLAKALEPRAAMPPSVSQSPTITSPAMTQAGMILGTAAYMSPEQARGKTIDRRADIWAFGAVLFEMLTGTRAFEDEDVSMTLSKVLQREPDFDTLPPTVPARVSQVLRLCLRKDSKHRVGDIRDVRLALDGAFETASPRDASAFGPAVAPRPLWMRAVQIAAAILSAVAITAAVVWNMKQPSPSPVVRFVVPLPVGSFARPTLSPDGQRLAYVLNDGQLMVRSISSLDALPVLKLDVAGGDGFGFSPDGQWIAFFSTRDRTLKKIAVDGGAALTICKVSGASPAAQSLSWSGDRIVFSQTEEGILGVSANGGEPEVLAKVTSQQAAMDPQIVDNGSTLLFTLATQAGNERWDTAQIVVQSLRSGERKVVLQGGAAARYVPTGHLVYAISGTLLAVPFDLDRREVRGSPVPLVEGVRRGPNNSGAALFSVSNDGTLAYAPGPATGSAMPGERTLAFLDRSGQIDPLPLPPQPYYHPRFSPDGKRLVVGTDNGKEAVVMIHDLTAGEAPRRLTFGGRNTSPVWTPDGERVAFLSDRDGDLSIFWQASNGAGVAARLTKAIPGVEHRPEAWTRDGSALAFLVTTGGGAGLGAGDIWTVSPRQGEPKPLVDGPFNQRFSAFSPDNRWLAYTSTEVGGRMEVFVQPFPPTGAKFQISNDGGQRPVWSPDGRELFYNQPSNQPSANRIVGIEIQTSPAFRAGKAVPIPFGQAVVFGPGTNFDIHPDGKRFVVVLEDPKRQADQFHVVLNWTEELKQRVPTK